jgi:hypothetical protein
VADLTVRKMGKEVRKGKEREMGKRTGRMVSNG